MESWLTKHEFLCSDQKTIADIQASHELDQTKFLEYDLSKWPNVDRWLTTMIDNDETQLEVAEKMRKLAISYNKKLWSSQN
jgi:glutathione S-transferase